MNFQVPTIDRYIFRELLKIFVISLGATTTLLYLDKFLFMAEMIINRGVTLMEMLWIVIFISPAFLAITIPISVLVASVVVFNQFSAYNEWVAMKGCQWSFLRLMRPVFYFSFLAYFLANGIMFYALPWGNQSYKQLIYDIIKNRANLDIKPNVFNRDFADLVLLIREKESNSVLKGVFIAQTQGTKPPQIISAQEGVIYSNPKNLKIQLRLREGTIHELSDRRTDYQILNFDGYDLTLQLPDTERLEKKALVGNRELSLSQIRDKIQTMKEQGLDPSGPEVELSKKFSIPFTCLLFGILGAPLGIKSSRSGRSGSFAASLGIILMYYMGLVVTQNLGRIGEINSYLSVWIPNLLVLAAVVYIGIKMQKEIPFKIFDRLSLGMEEIYDFFKKWICALTFRKPQEAVDRPEPAKSNPAWSGPTLPKKPSQPSKPEKITRSV